MDVLMRWMDRCVDEKMNEWTLGSHIIKIILKY